MTPELSHILVFAIKALLFYWIGIPLLVFAALGLTALVVAINNR